MATRKNIIPSQAKLKADAVAMVPEVIETLGRATKVYQAFALLIAMARFYILVDGRPDWTGTSQEAKNYSGDILTEAGITDRAVRARVLSSVRNHVSDAVREVMVKQGATDSTFVEYGMDKDSQSAKQKQAKSDRIVKSAKNNPTATVAALTAHLTDPKAGDPVEVVKAAAALLNGLVASANKNGIALDKQSAVADGLNALAKVSLALSAKLTGAAPARRSRTNKAA